MKSITLRPPQKKLPSPPEALEKPERSLWRKITETYDFNDDSAALSLLETAMIARGRARRCREIIDRDGECVTDRFDQIRQHPLLPAERGAQSVFVASMKSLNLSIGDLA
jgi:hypothetical protein